MTLTDIPPTQHAPVGVPARRGPAVAQVIGGGVLVLIGSLWLLERTGTIDLSVTAVLGLATMLVGVSLMLLANRDPHGGLIVFGTILAVVTLVTAIAPFEGFQGGLGDRTHVVSSVGDIQSDYNVAAGTLTIDLREIGDWQPATPLTASVGMGELVIRLPDSVEVEVAARVGAGEVEILGRGVDGVMIDESYRTPGFEPGSEGLVLELDVFAGRVEVTR